MLDKAGYSEDDLETVDAGPDDEEKPNVFGKGKGASVFPTKSKTEPKITTPTNTNTKDGNSFKDAIFSTSKQKGDDKKAAFIEKKKEAALKVIDGVGKGTGIITLLNGVGGNPVKIKTKDAIGLLFSLTYSSSPNKYDQYFYAYDQNDDNKIQTNLKDQNFNERILAGALLNLSWKINENNSVSFKNIYSINSEDRVIRRVGAFNLNQIDPLRTESNLFWFTSNQIITNQLNSEHFIPKTKTKVNLLVSNGNVDRLTPGMRRLLYTAGTGEKFQANI
jgi:hypothetical protein